METESKRLTQLLSFLEKSPNDPFIRFAIAKEFEKQESWDKALSYYQKTVEESPEYVGTYYHLGKLYQLMNKEDEALATYDQGMAVAKSQGDQHSYNELAGARLEIADPDD